MLGGERTCSRCGKKFKRRLVGVNLFAVRMERCPHCGAFNRYGIRDGSDSRSEETGPVEARQERDEESRLRERIEEGRYE